MNVDGQVFPVPVPGGAGAYGDDTGAANAYVVTASPAPVALAEGLSVAFKALAANTGASTLNVNGLGAKPITKSGTTALSGGEIAAGQIVTVIYDGANWQMQGTAGGSGGGPTSQADVTASRSLGAVFHNTGTTPMYVSVTINTTVNNESLQAITDGSNPPTTTVGYQAVSNSGTSTNIFFIVLPGHYYEVTTTSGGASFLLWMEWT